MVSAFATASGCSSSSSASSGDGGSGDTTCPKDPPTTGAPCALPSGVQCNKYPTAQPGCACCGSTIVTYVCVNGAWQEMLSASGSGGASPASVCPDQVPNEGDSCTPTCGGPMQQCNYDCAHGGGYVSTATCQQGSWHVTKSEIACEAADGGSDAPSDAPNDGG